MKTSKQSVPTLFKCIIAFWFLFDSTAASARSIVTGRFISAAAIKDASYFVPIDGFYNEFLDPHLITTAQDGSFSFELAPEKPGFVHIRVLNDDFPFLVIPNDTIHIDLYCTTNKRGVPAIARVVFSGNIASGCQAYLKNRVSQTSLIQSVFSVPAGKLEDLIRTSKEFIDSVCSYYDSLYARQLISKSFWEYIKSDTRGELSWRIYEHAGQKMVFDPHLAELQLAQRYLEVMTGRTLELSWANELSWQIVLEKDKKAFQRWYALFTSYFPESAFIPYLDKRIREKMATAVSPVKSRHRQLIVANE